MTACKVCEAQATTDPEASDWLKTIIEEGIIPNTLLAASLTRNGYPVTEASIRRHKTHLEGAV